MQPYNLKKIYRNVRTQFLLLESEMHVFVCLLALVPAPIEDLHLETESNEKSVTGIFSTKLKKCVAMT